MDFIARLRRPWTLRFIEFKSGNNFPYPVFLSRCQGTAWQSTVPGTTCAEGEETKGRDGPDESATSGPTSCICLFMLP